MSVRDTIILDRKDLRYLLIDSLRLYSDNVAFIDGNNPYRFSINKKTYYVLIKNVHESGDGRGNQDECRIQVAKSKNFNAALNSGNDVIVLGYFADEKVFTAWNPFMMRDRFNQKQTISLYSRFSIQKDAKTKKIADYRDNIGQSVISFIPDYLGLYLENLNSIHLLSDLELKKLVEQSDNLNNQNADGEYDTSEGVLTITHARQKRDPNFRIKVYDAYNNKCAMCGIGLELIEAAHIVPHSHELGTDEIDNGISLCALHHTAYDRSLIYFDEQLHILINENKMEYLEKVGIDSGIRKFEKLAFDKIQIPENHTLRPNIENIKIANQTRGIFDNDKKANNSPTLEYNKNNPFKSNNKYKKEDIYKFFSVPKEQQQGKWHNGYCEHNNNWFIFTNIGQNGHGFNLENEFDYNNTIDQFGDLNWEAINNSKLSWESIQKLKSSTPYIFIRKPETDINYWEYLGMGHCIYALDTTPVKFKWKILLEKTEIKDEDTTNKISNSKNEKTLKQWNKNIVPEKHKSRIITLINNDEIFEASQEYLNFAYENDQKDFSKIMDEFEKIIKYLGK